MEVLRLLRGGSLAFWSAIERGQHASPYFTRLLRLVDISKPGKGDKGEAQGEAEWSKRAAISQSP